MPLGARLALSFDLRYTVRYRLDVQTPVLVEGPMTTERDKAIEAAVDQIKKRLLRAGYKTAPALIVPVMRTLNYCGQSLVNCIG